MTYRIGLLTNDTLFAERLAKAFETEYPGEFQFMRFPGPEKCAAAAKEIKMDLILADLSFQPALNEALSKSSTEKAADIGKPAKTTNSEKAANGGKTANSGKTATSRKQKCPVFYLSDRPVNVGLSSNPQTTAERKPGDSLFKYKSVDEWHSELSCLCRAAPEGSPDGDDGSGPRPTGRPKLCLFTAGGGGVGTSTAAAAFAVHCAGRKQSVLYLDFQTFPSVENYFSGSNTYTLEDIIYALRSGRYEPETIFRRVVTRDASGVRFLLPCRQPPDSFSLNGEDIVRICEGLNNAGKFDVIILDMNFESVERIVVPFLNADLTVFVTDGNRTANGKTRLALEALPMITDLSNLDVQKKAWILYNRYTSGRASLLKDIGVGRLGGIHTQNQKSEAALVRELSTMAPFDRLSEVLHLETPEELHV